MNTKGTGIKELFEFLFSEHAILKVKETFCCTFIFLKSNARIFHVTREMTEPSLLLHHLVA